MSIFRNILAISAALLLAGCDFGSGEDFTIDVAASPNESLSALSSLDGNLLASALGVNPIHKEGGKDGSVRFVIPGGEYSDGTLDFAIAENGEGGSHISVTLDLPYVTRAGAKGTEYLSERKAEKMLQKQLLAWAHAKNMGSAGRAELDAVEGTLGSLAIAVQKWDKLDDPESMLANADETLLFGESEDSSSDWGNADGDNSADPMSDPEADAQAYGEPMDDTNGFDSYDEDDGGWGDDS